MIRSVGQINESKDRKFLSAHCASEERGNE